MQIRKKYRFYGRVQGVGFRFTTSHFARQLGITGFVRNEYDGSVSMEAQGDDYKLDLLIQYLSNDTYIRIDSMDSKIIPLYTGEEGFGVKF